MAVRPGAAPALALAAVRGSRGWDILKAPPVPPGMVTQVAVWHEVSGCDGAAADWRLFESGIGVTEIDQVVDRWDVGLAVGLPGRRRVAAGCFECARGAAWAANGALALDAPAGWW